MKNIYKEKRESAKKPEFYRQQAPGSCSRLNIRKKSYPLFPFFFGILIFSETLFGKK
jgi:hypothetical protein